MTFLKKLDQFFDRTASRVDDTANQFKEGFKEGWNGATGPKDVALNNSSIDDNNNTQSDYQNCSLEPMDSVDYHLYFSDNKII